MRIIKIFKQNLCKLCGPKIEKFNVNLKDNEQYKNFSIELVDMSIPEGMSQALMYDIMASPTFYVIDGAASYRINEELKRI